MATEAAWRLAFLRRWLPPRLWVVAPGVRPGASFGGGETGAGRLGLGPLADAVGLLGFG